MISVLVYSEEAGLRSFKEVSLLSDLLKDSKNQVWVDLEAATAAESEILSSVFHFHPLAIEDCISETLLPKIDDYRDYIFLVLHGSRAGDDQRFATAEMNFFLGPNYLVSYHDEPSRSIAKAKERCVKQGPSITHGVDFLLHEILDTMVDNYFPVLDQFDSAIDRIEEEVFSHPDRATLNKIFTLKKEIMHLRRVASPQREILNRLSRDNFPVISPKAAIYFRDIYDHLARITDLAESYRDLITSALDAYLSVISNRLNEIMKVLTIFTATLMPLTLITGIYGMNFDNIPELHTRYGYFVVLGIMLIVTAGMLHFFRKKKWL
ncbi:MAG: magnesium/cobalt transporter CorA [Nitrospirae bacterium]|nr:magnesium/cobalt transporter CorA [Candidatus Manganitrophaceae bacterium]